MTHAAGDTGWVAWTNTVDAQIATAQADILARLTAALAATTYDPIGAASAAQAAAAAALAAAVAIGAPTGVAYSAGWADYGTPFSPATWYKDKDGWIRLSGLLKRTGATIAAGAASGTIFTLPVGARPVGTETFIANQSGGIVFFQIDAAGAAAVYTSTGWTSGSSYMYVTGVMFKAA